MLLNMVGQQGSQGFLFGFGRRDGDEQSESVRLGKLPRAITADIDKIQVRNVFRRPLRLGVVGYVNIVTVRPFDNLPAIDVDFVCIAKPCGFERGDSFAVVVAHGKLDVVYFDIGTACVTAEIEHIKFGHDKACIG